MPHQYRHLPEGKPGKPVDKRDFPYYEGAWAFMPAGAVVRLWKTEDHPRRLISTHRYNLLPSAPDEPVRIQIWFGSELGSHAVPVELELLSV